jgi:hypothetical protein
MEDLEEMDDVKNNLIIPNDVDSEENDYNQEIDDEEEGEAEIDDIANKEKEDDIDIENEIFGLARENKEMKNGFANEEMLEKIDKIEDEMMDEKKW